MQKFNKRKNVKMGKKRNFFKEKNLILAFLLEIMYNTYQIVIY